MSELDLLRRAIDALDEQMVALFSKRMDISGQIGLIKRREGLPTLDESREQQVIERAVSLADEQLAPQIAELMALIMRMSKETQGNTIGHI